MLVKRLYCSFIILFFVLITAGNLYAVVASPHIRDLVQPDGSVINARQWGDEWLHGWETVEGYSIVKDNAGFWVYADRDITGRLFPTGIKAGTPVPKGQQRFLRPQGEVVKRALGKRREVAVQSVPTTGTVALPVILINYNDTETTNTSAEFESLLFGDNPAVATGPGSLKDYYEEISYKAFSLSSGPSGVSGWHTAANNHDYYGQNNASGNDMHAGELAKEAVLAADAAGVDFSKYDNDGDGKVDVVVIVHQGTGEEASNVANDIWSHRWTLTNAGVGSVTVDGVIVDDYIIQPERGSDGITAIGVFAHEFGHALGLPDLYDTDKSSEGIGEWCLMAGGSWTEITNAGDSPAHMSAWCKYFLGWVTPTVVSGTLTDEPIDQTATTADVYQLLGGSPLLGEYFLVENRQKTGFDQGLPGDGLLIWHIEGDTINYSMGTNEVNVNECYPGMTDCATAHYGVALEQADSLWELEKNVNRGDEGDPYFGSGNIYVIDGYARVQKFDSDGNFITTWGSEGRGDGQFGMPSGIAVDSSDNIYVIDGYARVQKFDSSGTFITTWGSEGSGDGQFGMPSGIAVKNKSFTDSSSPNSKLYSEDSSTVKVTDMSDSGSQMTATLHVDSDMISTTTTTVGSTIVPNLELTYPAGQSPKVFTQGWVFGVKCTYKDNDGIEIDISDQVSWGGTGTFSPDKGSRSYPKFNNPRNAGQHTIKLSVEINGEEYKEEFPVAAVPSTNYARVSDLARVPADGHGTPSGPFTAIGPILTGSENVSINGLPAARVGDSGIHAMCAGSNMYTIVAGDENVLIDGRPAARRGDQTEHCGGLGRIVTGSEGPDMTAESFVNQLIGEHHACKIPTKVGPREDEGGTISGKVTDTLGTGIKGVGVTAYGDTNIDVWGTITDENGTYQITGLPDDSFYIHFWGGNWVYNDGYLSSWYNNKTSMDTADTVTITGAGTVTGIDVTLSAGGSISGTVKDASGGGIEKATVGAYGESGGTSFSYTDESGEYQIAGLEDDSYLVYCDAGLQGYSNEWYNDKSSQDSADSVTVTASNQVSGIDFTLSGAGGISGTVKDTSGNGIEEVYVKAFGESTSMTGMGATDENGAYEILGIPDDSYRVQFQGESKEYINQWYRSKSSWDTAGLVAVTAPNKTTGVDAELSLESEITTTTTTDSITTTSVKANGVIHTGMGIALDGGYINFGTGNIFYTVAFPGYNGYLYASSYSNPTIYFADVIPQSPCSAYNSGYEGVYSIQNFTSAEDHVFTTGHTLYVGDKDSGCNQGILLFQQGGLYGGIDIVDIDAFGTLHFNWWYDDSGNSDFSGASDPTLCPSETIYGTDSEETELLRYFRDNVLAQTPEGQELIKLYYQWSPVIVQAMENDEEFKEEVTEMVEGILPLVEETVE